VVATQVESVEGCVSTMAMGVPVSQALVETKELKVTGSTRS
jgi:hypothetical protein